MGKEGNKAKFVLYAIAILVSFLYTVGMLVLYAKFDDLENVHEPISIFASVVIAGIVFNLILTDKKKD